MFAQRSVTKPQTKFWKRRIALTDPSAATSARRGAATKFQRAPIFVLASPIEAEMSKVNAVPSPTSASKQKLLNDDEDDEFVMEIEVEDEPREAEEAAKCKSMWQVGLTVLTCAVYMLVGPMLIMSNKYLLTTGQFHFPILLTALHQTSSAICSAVLVRQPCALMPLEHEVTWSDWWRRIFAVGMLTTAALCTGNASYLYLTVSFIEILKGFTPVVTMMVQALFGEPLPTCRIAMAVLMISLGTAISSFGELNLNLTGLLFMLASVYCEATRLMLTQRLLTHMNLHVLVGHTPMRARAYCMAAETERKRATRAHAAWRVPALRPPSAALTAAHSAPPRPLMLCPPPPAGGAVLHFAGIRFRRMGRRGGGGDAALPTAPLPCELAADVASLRNQRAARLPGERGLVPGHQADECSHAQAARDLAQLPRRLRRDHAIQRARERAAALRLLAQPRLLRGLQRAFAPGARSSFTLTRRDRS